MEKSNTSQSEKVKYEIHLKGSTKNVIIGDHGTISTSDTPFRSDCPSAESRETLYKNVFMATPWIFTCRCRVWI